METTKIYLEFDKTIYGLAGYDYGVEVFKKQVEPKINYDKHVVIVFPDTIEVIASSFIQGMFAEIIANVGYKGVQENFDFKGGPELGDIKNQILQDLI